MTNEYPVDGNYEECFGQVGPIFCDENFNFTEYEPPIEKVWLYVKIEQAINYFETKVRKGLIEFLFTGKTDKELFLNN